MTQNETATRLSVNQINADNAGIWHVSFVTVSYGRSYILDHLPSGKQSVCVIRSLRSVMNLISNPEALNNYAYFRLPVSRSIQMKECV